MLIIVGISNNKSIFSSVKELTWVTKRDFHRVIFFCFVLFFLPLRMQIPSSSMRMNAPIEIANMCLTWGSCNYA